MAEADLGGREGRGGGREVDGGGPEEPHAGEQLLRHAAGPARAEERGQCGRRRQQRQASPHAHLRTNVSRA